MTFVEHRSHDRQKLRGPVTIFWTDTAGDESCDGNCVDVSTYGILIEVPRPIPVRTNVRIEFHQSSVCSQAHVRHFRKHGTWFRVGFGFHRAHLKTEIAPSKNSNG